MDDNRVLQSSSHDEASIDRIKKTAPALHGTVDQYVQVAGVRSQVRYIV